MPLFRRPRGLGRSNKFGQMQELTNNNYSDISLCSIFHIEFFTNKKRTNNDILDPPFAGAAPLSFQYGEFVNMVNV